MGKFVLLPFQVAQDLSGIENPGQNEESGPGYDWCPCCHGMGKWKWAEGKVVSTDPIDHSDDCALESIRELVSDSAPLDIEEPEIVGRQCFPSAKMASYPAYHKKPWVDGEVGKEPSEPGFYRIEPLIHLSGHRAKIAELQAEVEKFKAAAHYFYGHAIDDPLFDSPGDWEIHEATIITPKKD